MTLEEIEAAGDAGRCSIFAGTSPMHFELPLRETFYPLGFPAELTHEFTRNWPVAEEPMGNLREAT